MRARLDAVVVGSGPNGLAAAVVLAAAGLSVRVYEMAPTPGGGCRTEELTLPGYRHDVCSAAHPMAVASGFFQRFGLADRGVRLLQPEVSFAHPLDGGRAGAVWPSLVTTAIALGDDTDAWFRLFAPLVRHFAGITDEVLSPMRRLPHNPGALGRFGMLAIRSATRTASRFSGDEARGLIAGVAAHGMLPLDRPVTGGVGILLGMLGMAVGWPVVEGGSAALVPAMLEEITSRGGEIVTGEAVTDLAQLPVGAGGAVGRGAEGSRALGRRPPAGTRPPASRAVSLRIGRVQGRLGACGSGALDSRSLPAVRHGARRRHIRRDGAASEAEVAAGRHPERPYVLCVQPSVVDRTRAPEGPHTLWAYCHVPAGSTLDMERGDGEADRSFCPGVRDLVLASAIRTARDVEAHNPNYVGGDIGAGVQDLRQTFARPALRWNPYRTGIPGVYLCSSSTPPGPGVHGRCGELAAQSVLSDSLRHPAAAGHRTSPVGAVVTGGTPNDRGVSAPPRRKPPALSAGCRRPPAPQRLRRR